MERETNNLANYFSQNAINMAAALHFEDYEECEVLRQDKNKHIALFLNLMHLFTEVDDLQAVRELDATYEAILAKAKSELHNILANNLHKSK